MQALEDERLGPRKPGVQSYERRKRLAVQEAATALACTLMPAIEPVISVRLFAAYNSMQECIAGLEQMPFSESFMCMFQQ